MGWGVGRVVHEPARFHLNQSGLCGERIAFGPLVDVNLPVFVGHDIDRVESVRGVQFSRTDEHGLTPLTRRPFDHDFPVEVENPLGVGDDGAARHLLLPENELHDNDSLLGDVVEQRARLDER